jgi:alpha-ribazole phosphatase/probable phosphoglycerate mutase
VFCSDLRRSYETAELAFGLKFPIIRDARLREINYGHLEGESGAVVQAQKSMHIRVPFRHGESYLDTTAKMKDFLNELQQNYDGKTVMIIGHRATQYALENLINGIPLEKIIPAPWKWQPGWEYTFEKLA